MLLLGFIFLLTFGFVLSNLLLYSTLIRFMTDLKFKIVDKLEIINQGLYDCGEFGEYSIPNDSKLDMWNSYGIACLKGDEVVAECSMNMQRSSSLTKAILNIFVKEEFRKQGIGKLIIQEAIKHCKKLSCHCIQLQISKNNIACQKLAKSNGFKKAGYYPDKFDGEKLICYLNFYKFFVKTK